MKVQIGRLLFCMLRPLINVSFILSCTPQACSLIISLLSLPEAVSCYLSCSHQGVTFCRKLSNTLLLLARHMAAFFINLVLSLCLMLLCTHHSNSLSRQVLADLLFHQPHQSQQSSTTTTSVWIPWGDLCCCCIGQTPPRSQISL